MSKPDKIIIALAGEMGCGKGSLAKYIVERHQAEIYRFSWVLGDILDRLHIEKSRYNFSHLSTMLRDSFGQSILSEVVKHDIEKSQAEFIVIDGVRREEDIAYFRDIPGFQFIFIDTEIPLRYARIIARNEKVGENTKTLEEFIEENECEAEVQTRHLRDSADIIITNNTAQSDMEEQFEKFLENTRQ